MNVMMVTNTYLPHVGGVAQSVYRFTKEYRARGHRVLVACPKFEEQPTDEDDVLRVAAIQNFNGSDFSMSLPTLLLNAEEKFDFRPDVIHAHHPYLMGDSALRLSAAKGVPLVFTHHTMYEQYTHYVPGDSPALKRFIVELSTRYANTCQAVIAPSESIQKTLVERGVETPVHVIPTGVDLETFSQGESTWIRRRLRIADDAFVIGHLGRLAEEKNLLFLTRAVCGFLAKDENSHFLIVGNGPAEDKMIDIATEAGVAERVHFAGRMTGRDVVDAYANMDAFAFASQSETQGMVVAESMAAGTPVVAVDAPGVREVVSDGENGRLLQREDESAFAEALAWVRDLEPGRRKAMRAHLEKTARRFSTENQAERALALYEEIVRDPIVPGEVDMGPWERLQLAIQREWDLWSNRVAAAAEALAKSDERKREKPQRKRANGDPFSP